MVTGRRDAGAYGESNTLAGLREQEREVWLEGERSRIRPRTRGCAAARAIASLYDMHRVTVAGDKPS
jgi:hypothetical protein